jgi:hypothetical protein
VRPAGILGEVAAGAGAQGGENRRVVGVGRQDHDGDLGVAPGQPARGLDAVEHGHVEVEKDHVGMLAGDGFEGRLAVGRGGDHLDVGEQAEQHDESFAHAGLVVGDDDPQRCRPAGHRGTFAVTTQSFPSGPALSVPSRRRRRSRIPVSPYPAFAVASSASRSP